MTDYREIWRTVPGWCAFAEAYKHAINVVPSPGLIVEIGSWQGKSACLMAALIRESGKAIEFCCIDPWKDGGPDLQHTPFKIEGENKLYQSFLDHTKEFRSEIKPIRGLSGEVFHTFADQSIDYLMIDGDHSYEGVRDDIANYLPKMKPGGIVAGDDYLWPGVTKAFHEAFGDRVRTRIKKEHRDYRQSVAYCWVQL